MRTTKKVLLFFVCILVVFAITGIWYRKTNQQVRQTAQAGENILEGNDVTDLSGRGMVKADSYDRDLVYLESGKDSGSKGEIDISSLPADSSASVVEILNRLYQKDDISGMYACINKSQLMRDGIGDLSEEELKSFFQCYGDPGECRFFKIKEYIPEGEDYCIVCMKIVPVESNVEGNVLYDHEKAVEVRFTYWERGEHGFLFVPYSVLDGVPDFFLHREVNRH